VILSRARGFRINGDVLDAIQDCDAVHLVPLSSDEFSMDAYCELRKGFGKLISIDGQGFTKFPIAGLGGVLTGNIDILKLDEAEILQITGFKDEPAAVNEVRKWAVSEILVTKASRGSTIYIGGDSYSIPPVTAPKIVDATGCGDAYAAGYLAGRLRKYSPEASARFASRVAAKNLEFRGAIKEDLSGWSKS
jgi:sugar/nucleoside kinase (ribokinase family)